MRVILLALLLMFCGCASSTRSVEPYHSERFTHRPEIWIKGDNAYCRLRESTMGIRSGTIKTDSYMDEIRVYVHLNISVGGISDQMRRLYIPGAAAPKLSRMQFFWRDPDGTLHPMSVHYAAQ